MSHLEGIDISEHNGSIDWPKVKSGAEFCFIKATEGRTFTDARLTSARVKEAVASLGTKRVGYYAFARPDNNPAVDEARAFIAAVKKVGGRIGRNGVLDYETPHPNDADELWIAAWVHEYQRLTGSRPIIYGGSTLRDQGVKSDFGCPLWLAAYTSSPTPYVPVGWRNPKGPRLRIWQYSDNGTCPGLSGAVDRNRFYGTPAELDHLLS